MIAISLFAAAATGLAVAYVHSRKQLAQAEIKAIRAEEQLKAQEVAYGERLKTLENALAHKEESRKQMAQEFENLANRVLEKNGQKLREDSMNNLEGVLKPFRERLQDLHKKVDESYHHESRERHLLKDLMERVANQGQRMAQETENLTKALKGDVKAQGNWGELILERILESSGLRSGIEYTTQGEQLDLRDAEGRVQRPDVIVNLPDGKHVIVDSKVSLVHYEACASASSEEERLRFLKLFQRSLQEHIRGLAEKKYQTLEKLNTPEFVLMFIPMEGAFAMGLSTDAELFNFAWDRKVIMVGPTTLLATLKTIASVWKQENQAKNAQEIARMAGLMYDDFVRLYDEMVELGDTMGKAEKMHVRLLGRIKDGRTSLIGRSQKIKELGAKNSKELPAPEGL